MSKYGELLVFVSAFLYGCNPLISKSIYLYGGTPITLVFFRLLIGSLGMGVLHFLCYKDSVMLTKSQLKNALICSLFFCATPLLLWSSYHYLPSGLSTTINFSYPSLVLLGSYLIYHHRITQNEFISCILSMFGIICLCQVNGSIHVKGVILAFLSALTFALYVLFLANSNLIQLPPFKLNFWISILGAAESLVIGVLTSTLTFQIAPKGWFLIVLLAISSGILASTAFQQGTRYIGAQKASLLSTFEPLTSIFIGITVYHETFSLRAFLGILSVLISVLLLSIFSSQTVRKIKNRFT